MDCDVIAMFVEREVDAMRQHLLILAAVDYQTGQLVKQSRPVNLMVDVAMDVSDDTI